MYSPSHDQHGSGYGRHGHRQCAVVWQAAGAAVPANVLTSASLVSVLILTLQGVGCASMATNIG